MIDVVVFGTEFSKLLGKTNLTQAGLIHFGKEGVSVKRAKDSMTVATDLTIDKKMFVKYKVSEESVVAFGDMTLFLKLMSKFPEIRLVRDDKTKDVLFLSSEKHQLTFNLADPEFVEQELPDFGIKYESKPIKVGLDEVKKIKEMLDTVTTTAVGRFKSSEGFLYFIVGDESKVEWKLKIGKFEGDAEVIFQTDVLKEVLNVITETELNFFIKSNYPMQISEASKFMTATYTICPITDAELQKARAEEKKD